jgi:hypothetical protein
LKPRVAAVVGDELLRSFDIRNPETQKSERAKNSRTVEFHLTPASI